MTFGSQSIAGAMAVLPHDTSREPSRLPDLSPGRSEVGMASADDLRPAVRCSWLGCTSTPSGNWKGLCLAHWEQYLDFWADAQAELEDEL